MKQSLKEILQLRAETSPSTPPLSANFILPRYVTANYIKSATGLVEIKHSAQYDKMPIIYRSDDEVLCLLIVDKFLGNDELTRQANAQITVPLTPITCGVVDPQNVYPYDMFWDLAKKELLVVKSIDRFRVRLLTHRPNAVTGHETYEIKHISKELGRNIALIRSNKMEAIVVSRDASFANTGIHTELKRRELHFDNGESPTHLDDGVFEVYMVSGDARYIPYWLRVVGNVPTVDEMQLGWVLAGTHLKYYPVPYPVEITEIINRHDNKIGIIYAAAERLGGAGVGGQIVMEGCTAQVEKLEQLNTLEYCQLASPDYQWIVDMPRSHEVIRKQIKEFLCQ